MKVAPIENDEMLAKHRRWRDLFAAEADRMEADPWPEFDPVLVAATIASHRSVAEEFDARIKEYEEAQK